MDPCVGQFRLSVLFVCFDSPLFSYQGLDELDGDPEEFLEMQLALNLYLLSGPCRQYHAMPAKVQRLHGILEATKRIMSKGNEPTLAAP